MRVLLAGDFRWDRLAASYRRAFGQLGHEVVPFDTVEEARRLAGWLRNRYGHRLTRRSLAARRHGSTAYNAALRQRVEETRPALVLAFNGDYIMPETIRAIRREGASYLTFHADNPFPPHYNNRPETLTAARECDRYLVWSRLVAEQLREVGVNADFLAFGWDPEVFPFQAFPSRQPHDVTFIGGWDREREAFLEEVAKHFPLRIWGPAYWGTRTRKGSRVRDCWQGGSATGHEAAAILARSKINLNILRGQHYTNGRADGVIMRTFEAPGAGAFLLSTRSGGATELFPEGEGAGYFDDVEECLSRIEHYLSSAEERRRIAEEGHRIVDAGHHYHHRAGEILARHGG